MLKQYRTLITLLLLALPALACSLGGSAATPAPTSAPAQQPTTMPAPTQTPLPAPTATPDVTADFTSYENEEIGVSFQYPAGWELQDNQGFITIASDPELLTSNEFNREGAGVIVLAGPALELAEGSLEDALRQVIEEFDFSENAQIVEGPIVTSVDGQEAAVATVEGMDEAGEQKIVFYVTLVRHEGQAAVAAGVTLKSLAAQFRPTLEAITSTLQVRQPTLPQAEGTIQYGDNVHGVTNQNRGSAWSFIGVQGESVDITVSPVDEALDATVDVLDSNGNSVLENVVDESFGTEEIHGLTLPKNDEYTILVRGFAGSSGEYELTLSEAGTLSTAAALNAGSSITGTIGPDEQTDYTFRSAEGSPVTIVVEPEGELDVVVEVVDSAGSVLIEEDSSFGREEVRFTPEAGADYVVRVRGFAGDSGDYAITIRSGAVGGTGTTIRTSDTLEEGDSEGHSFPFTALTDDVITAIVEPAGEFDIVVEVWNDDSDEVEDTVDLSFGVEEVNFTVPETGNYYFNVLGFEGQGGKYDMTLSGPPSVIFELLFGDEIEGTVGDEGFIEYTIRLDPNETMIVTVAGDADMDPALEIYDLDDNLLAEVDEGFSGEEEELVYTAPADVAEGTIFIIRVKDFFGEAGGTYTMDVREG